MQQIQASLLPFYLHRKTLEVPNGLTLEQMVDAVFPKKNISGIRIVVNIGDQVIPQSQWKSIKPKPMTLVGINAVAAGGKGKKNPLATIISIALVVAAPYITAALAPGLAAGIAGAVGPYTAGQFALASGIIRVGVSAVSFLATSMLASTPKQQPRAQPSPTESATQFIEGATNAIDRYGPIPVNLGVNRMFPKQAALPFTETSANKQYARQLFTYGFGKVQVSERKIGETALSEYSGVEISDRLNGDLNTGTYLYSNDVVQDGYSAIVSNAGGAVTRTTQEDVDEAQIDLTFANGMVHYNSAAQRENHTVNFEVRYALTGTTDWINRATDVAYGSQSVNVPFPAAWIASAGKRVGYAVLVLNLTNGVVSAVSHNFGATPIIPPNSIRIASLRTESTSTTVSGGTANIYDIIDERSSYVPAFIEDPADFAFTYGGTGLSISVAAGTVMGSKTGVTKLTVTAATAQALRVTKSLIFPTRDQYDIQITKLNVDSVSDQTREVATLTAVRSIRYSAPVNQEDISGSAMRILATDQLNNTVDRYNCIVATLAKDYDAALDEWVEDVVTSNCASVYRYVLQSPAFVKRLSDSRIDLEKLEEWHAFCKLHNLTYNRVVEQTISIDDLLSDIAAAGMATPHKINGNYSVLIDNERPDIKGMVTPRNSWGYNGSITYPDLPHALRIKFRNKNKGYADDERIVYKDGYDSDNATLYESIRFDSCTDSDLAWFYGRIYMSTIILQPEIHNFNQDFENLTYNRGDKIVFVNDSILVGIGQARISDLTYDDPDTPTEVIGFTLDETVTIPTVDDFGVRIRHGDASGFTYHGLVTAIGETDEFVFSVPIPVAEAPPLDSLCAFTEFGEELELIITDIKANKDHSANITAVNYAQERYDAVNGAIPPFDSNVTLPLNFYRPLPPELSGQVQSDESVMLRNSDGSYIGRMFIPLINKNETSVSVSILARTFGATEWFRPDILSISPELVVLTGLEDGSVYDFDITYYRQGGLQISSQPLSLRFVTYQGATSLPANVSNFKVTTSDSTGLFYWDNNADIDISHYVMKFTRLTEDAEWSSAQIVANNIVTNRISLPIQSGTYLIKAVDILGNESADPTVIISFDNGAFNNVVELLDQQPAWAGVHDNTHSYEGDLYLVDPTLPGYYYFDPEPFDLGDVYESTLSSSLEAIGAFYNRIRVIDSIRDVDSIRGAGSNIMRSASSIRALSSVRGIDPSDWSITLQMRISDDDITYTDWADFTVGKHIFRYLELRLLLISTNDVISPRVSTAEVLIDMPDRYETGEDVECTSSGAIITYEFAFRNNPAVNITLQDGAVDDKLEYVYKTSEGFHVKVYNATAAGYVTRSLDYNSAGYGRIIV